jgi:aspartyl-tRNA(Asn)/glutamyl-tRNA(Gln) amidotransferase subunit A
MKAIEKLRMIKSGKLSAVDNVKNFLEKIKKENKKINAILQINDNALLQAKEVDSNIRRGKASNLKLAGLVVAVKSNINVKGLNASCASKTLENYKAGYDATVIKKLKDAGAIVIGMANCDEFASGSSGMNSAFGATKNPKALDRIPGGSSSGSAAAVAAEFCDVALGSDTGGSIRNPASHCGVVGFKPSYGAVSRYGLIDLAMSLDQIGPFANNVADAELIFDVIKGKDEKDATSIELKGSSKIGKINIGIPKISADPEISSLINDKVNEVIKKNNWKKQNIEIKHIDLGIQTYYPINYVEFFSGTRKFDGRRYGKKIEDSCGEEVLRRILGGQMISQEEFSGRYYKKALDAKAIIAKEFEKAFQKVRCIVMPVVPGKIGEKLSVEQEYQYDTLSVLANLAEVPAISVPAGKINGVPMGIQILCQKGRDKQLLDIAKRFEK